MDLALRFLGHSTIRVELAGRVVLTDPVPTPGSRSARPDTAYHCR